MGLRPLAVDAWLEVDDRRAADLAEKRRLLTEVPDQVLAVVDDPDGAVLEASQELLDRVLAHLAAVPGAFGAGGAGDLAGGLHPIDAAGRSTQEDWCLHLPDPQGRWRLVAASVCFPTRWDLRTKIGRTIREIHEPVPLYEDQLADPMDAYFDRMRPEQGAWRLNWNLLDDPALHQPTRPAGGVPLTADRVAEQLWLRVERQTLVRLPVSGAIVFGIRIHLDPLGSLVGDAEGRARLARSLEALPPEVVEDKQLAEISAVVLDWLSTQDAIG